MADPCRLVAAAAEKLHVRGVEGGLLLDDPALLLDPARLHVTLDEVEALDHAAAPVGGPAEDLAGLAALAPGDDDHGIVPAQPLHRHAHSTSGASEMIFMNRFARSSRATGPKMRVPSGSRALSMRTAELVSNRM